MTKKSHNLVIKISSVLNVLWSRWEKLIDSLLFDRNKKGSSQNVINRAFIFGSIKRRRVLFFSILTLAITLPIMYLTLRYQTNSEAAWFNDQWTYRQTVNITNAGSAQTNYQVNLSIGTSALVVAGKIQSDCDDVRITDINGKLLPHWIESSGNSCNSVGNSTTIWTKAPSIPTSGITLYIYYGNPSASNTEDLNKIFDTNLSQRWEFDSSTESWGDSLQQMTTPTAANGIWSSTYSAASDPFFRSPSGLTITASTTKYIFFKIRVTNGQASPQLFWITNLDGTETEAKSVSKTWTYNGNWQILAFNVGADGDWANTVTRLRLDPVASGTGNVDIDWVRIHNSGSSYPSVAAPTNEENSPGPVAYFKFDEGYGTSTRDSSSTRLTGTIVNGASWQTEERCVSGKCLYFDGSDDQINISNAPIFTPSDNWSVSFWAKPNPSQTAWQGIINFKAGEGWGIYARHTNNANTPFFYTETTSTGATNQYFSGNTAQSYTNDWKHFTLTKTSNTYRWYINGKLDNTQNKSSGDVTNNTTSTWTIAFSYSLRYKGLIDELKVYKYARSASQVTADYNEGTSGMGSIKGTSASFGSKPQEYLSEGLVGYWKLDESSGNASDSSGVGNTGALGTGSSAPAWATGKYGNSSSFDGNDFINVGDPSSGILDFGTGDFTLSAWFYLNSLPSAWTSIINKGGAGAAGYGLDINTSNQLCGSIQAASGTNQHSCFTTLTAGTWTHATVVFSRNDKVYMYINGSLAGTEVYGAGNTNSISNSSYFYLGSYTNSGGWFLNGKIDEVRIYNRKFSPKEVSDLYNWAPGPVAYYNFEEATGNTLYNRGVGNTGTWSGSTAKHYTRGKYGGAGTFTSGNSDFVNIGNDSSFPTGTSPRTLCTWAYTTSTSGSYAWAFAYGTAGTNQSFFIGRNGTTLYGGGYGNDITVSNFWATNVWNHVCLVFDGANASMYTNGNLAVSPTAKAWNTVLSVAYVGRQTNGGEYWDGKVDEVKLYNYALSAKQVVADMNAGHPAVGSPVGSAVGHWKFDEGVGTTVNNSGSAGSVINGSFGASPRTPSWTQSGKFGKAVDFDASTPSTADVINVSDNAALQFTTGMTVSAWIYPDTATGQSEWIMSRALGVTPWDDYLLRRDGTGVRFSVRLAAGLTTATAASSISPNNWYHVVGTYDATTGMAYVYVNGVQKSSASGSGNIQVSSTKFKIGCWGTSTDNCDSTTPFNGIVDEVKVYNYALTTDEVKLDYNQGSSMVLGALSQGSGSTAPGTSAAQEYCVPGDSTSCAAPIGRWDFEEGSGGTAYDKSGNAFSGTWNGTGTRWTSGKVGKGGNFNGSDDYIDLGSSSTLIGSGTKTVEFWIKPGSSSYLYTQYDGAGVNYDGKTILLNSDRTILIAWGLGTGTGITTTDTLNSEAWNHIAAVFDTGTTGGKIYFNGKLVLTGNLGTEDTNVNKLRLCGRWATPNSGSAVMCNSQIDQVRIYNYARSAAQIAWDYNRGGPTDHWKFDEGQGSIAYNSMGTGNTGVITIGTSGTQNILGTIASASTAWGNGATGKRNYSLNFDGTDDYVNLGSTTYLDTSKPFTLSAWSYLNDFSPNTYPHLLTLKATGSSTPFEVVLSDQANYLGITFGSNATWGQFKTNTASASLTGSWKNIVVTYNGSGATTASNFQVFIDGISQTIAAAGAYSALTNSSAIGGPSGGGSSNFWDGKIDDVKVYNYVLTTAQIRDVYNNGAVTFTPSTGAP